MDEDVARVLAGTGGDPDKIRENVSGWEDYAATSWAWWQGGGKARDEAAGIGGTRGGMRRQV